jgi:transcriptional regulator with XRE-family HTH domain
LRLDDQVEGPGMTEPVDHSHRSATALDVYLGVRLREIRLERDMSQAALAKAIGVSFQQVQKYEASRNRIAASTLYKICQALDASIASMFDGFEPAKKERRR